MKRIIVDAVIIKVQCELEDPISILTLGQFNYQNFDSLVDIQVPPSTTSFAVS